MLPKILKKHEASWIFRDKMAIARQFYASKKENKIIEGFSNDPMGEKSYSEEGHNFIHKYPEKLLILASDKCPVLCRFCTRKRITFKKHTITDQFTGALKYIKSHPEIRELIFSGGDPFMLSDTKLENMISTFLKMNQLARLRFHTRAITMIPERFTENLFQVFLGVQTDEVQYSIVIHVNHPRELTPESLYVINQFKKFGISIRAQTVLLKKINDRPEVLKELFSILTKNGVQPYYLHQLDRVTGSAHFEVSPQLGLAILESIRREFPACLIPPYVMDGPQGKKSIR